MLPRSLCAWLLLAVFTAGGAVAPSVHRAQHSAERAAWLADHLGTAEHHHDTPDAPHGDEAQRSCPTTPAVDWQCTLCHGVSASLLAGGTRLGPRLAAWSPTATAPAWRAAPTDASSRDRGPPRV